MHVNSAISVVVIVMKEYLLSLKIFNISIAFKRLKCLIYKVHL